MGSDVKNQSRRVMATMTKWRAIVAVVAGILVMPLLAQAQEPAPQGRRDLVELPIEELLTLEVYSASKFIQKFSDAPSAVSVVTAADIRDFGWRTVADILRTMRGLYISDDRNYSYLGARGFLRPGDYNSRFLLLVDGLRTNDTVFDQASIGTEFVLGVDLIDRVEFVPGPGSSIYGANAFFGVINIITKRGRDVNGRQVSGEIGSHGTRKMRASYGKRMENDAEVLISVTSYRKDGQDLYFREFDTPATNNGVARGLDHDRADSVLFKGGFGSFSLLLAHGERKKGVPTASYNQAFNDPRSHTVDAQSFLDIGYKDELSPDAEIAARLYWARYDYDGDYIYDYPPLTVNRDQAHARWWGAEAKLVSVRFTGHKLVAGAEYQYANRRDQKNFDVDPYASYLDDRRNGRRTGLYLQDEITLREDLLLNAGVRYDSVSHPDDSAINPRIALIYKATPMTTFKAMYGTAYRSPNAYEMYYALENIGGQKANPELKAERIRSQELSAEHRLSADARITASIFRNTVSNLMTQTTDPADGLLVFRNIDRATAHGIELEYEHVWSTRGRLRTGYSWQQTRNRTTGETLANSPRHLANFNWSQRIFNSAWRLGAEALYAGRRKTLEAETGGYWLGNLTLSSTRLAPGLEVSASIYNLFDRRYADPGAEEHLQDTIRQSGRTFRLKAVYTF